MKNFPGLLNAVCSKRIVNIGISRYFSASKKDTSNPIAAVYNSKAVESAWYKWWEDNGFFRRKDSQENFVMILPPPNITGQLHLGHALTCTVQDVLARWHQMNGRNVVWVPGCDHAGIATQVVVERHLLATKNVTRHQLGRERFVGEILKWKEQKGTQIYEQMKRLGVSLDWDRAFYTLDENICTAVNEAFIRLFESGLIYRKMMLVNWCCELQSAISNIEVEHLELEGPTPLQVPGYEKPVTFGNMYDFAYRICGSDEVIVVSTTRPETMLGDTAVMVNPEDGRYVHLIGKKVYHPFRKEEINIIADAHVNPELGTGAVKVTPAHDMRDFEIGERHNLPQISIFDEQGKINMSEFRGQPRFTARDSVLHALDQLGLYYGCRPHPMVVPVCSRTNDIIEPLLKPQWYLNTTDMAKKAVAAVENGSLDIQPKNYKIVWKEFLEKQNRDWCISRQLWWGHRIPVYCIKIENSEIWIAAVSEGDAKEKFVKKSGLPENEIISIKQDEDVLDTWFSSGLLPFASFGWPQNTPDYNQLYPLSVLETGHDILFFWVGRMVMLGLQLTGKLPFKKVLLHGLIHDGKGQKMSKSKGNVIDPMDVINGVTLEELQSRVAENEMKGIVPRKEAKAALKYQATLYPKGIPECGADGLRLFLCWSDMENDTVPVDIVKIERNKFLCNKIWQAMRFLMSALEGVPNGCCTHVNFSQNKTLQLMDRWILSHLSHLVSNAQENIPAFNFHLFVRHFEKFWYDCLCSVYLESIKPSLKSSDQVARYTSVRVLWTCMDVCLHLLSPFMPFLTEELYQRLPRQCDREDSILKCHYPQQEEWDCWRNVHLESQMKVLLEVIVALRTMKHPYHQKTGTDIQGSIVTKDYDLKPFLEETTIIVKTLARINSFVIYEAPAKPPVASAVTPISDATFVHLHLEGLIDPIMELERLNKNILKLRKSENEMMKRIAHKNYTKKTSLSAQESHQAKLATLRREMEEVAALIEVVKTL